MPTGQPFISTNLEINRIPVINNCIGGCKLTYSGYKRHVCVDCYIEFAKYNIDPKLIKLNNSVRSKLNVIQPSIIFSNTGKSLLEILENNNDILYHKTDYENLVMELWRL